MAPFGVVRCAHDLTNPNGRVCFFSFGPIEANGAVRAMNAQLLISWPDVPGGRSAAILPPHIRASAIHKCQGMSFAGHGCQELARDQGPAPKAPEPFICRRRSGPTGLPHPCRHHDWRTVKQRKLRKREPHRYRSGGRAIAALRYRADGHGVLAREAGRPVPQGPGTIAVGASAGDCTAQLTNATETQCAFTSKSSEWRGGVL